METKKDEQDLFTSQQAPRYLLSQLVIFMIQELVSIFPRTLSFSISSKQPWAKLSPGLFTVCWGSDDRLSIQKSKAPGRSGGHTTSQCPSEHTSLKTSALQTKCMGGGDWTSCWPPLALLCVVLISLSTCILLWWSPDCPDYLEGCLYLRKPKANEAH